MPSAVRNEERCVHEDRKEESHSCGALALNASMEQFIAAFPTNGKGQLDLPAIAAIMGNGCTDKGAKATRRCK
jgi:hypothetical protein